MSGERSIRAALYAAGRACSAYGRGRPEEAHEWLQRAERSAPTGRDAARAEHDAGVIYARLLHQADELERSVPPEIRRAANLAAAAAYPDGKNLPFSGALALGEYARILYLRRYLNTKKEEQ